jgi:RecA-family ATPase
MTAADIARELGGHRSGSGFICRCPAHEDAKPSLSLNDGDDGRVLWRCHAGCEQAAVGDALRARGLLNGSERDEPRHELHMAALGAPSHVWTYRDAKGAELFKVARYETSHGKEIRPWRREGLRWIAKALPDPRPLYGLDLLARRADLPVLVVEGEKCADAAHSLIASHYVVVTWPGGAKATDKSDWTVLHGRQVTIWPDADAPGRAAASRVASALAGKARVAILDVDERPDRWDVADAVADGWSADDLLTFIDEHASLSTAQQQEAKPDRYAVEVIDATALLETAPAPTRWIVDGWLADGASGMVGAHGGTGKSWFVLQLAVCIAVMYAFLGLATVRRRVLVYSCEDRAEVLRYRLHRIVDALGITLEPGALHLVDQTRKSAALVGSDGLTALYEELRHAVERTGAEVLIIDSASDAFSGSEIARAEVRRYITECQALVPDTGAVLHVAHVDKAHARGSASGQAYSGSTAWHNSVRQRWELARVADDTDEDRRRVDLTDPRRLLTLAKSNYGPAGAELALRFDAARGLFVPESNVAAGGIVDSIRERTEREALLRAFKACADAAIAVPAAMQGPRTAYHVLTLQPAFPEALQGGTKAKTRRFWRHIEALRQIQHVTEEGMRRTNRHVVATLVLTPEGRAACA